MNYKLTTAVIVSPTYVNANTYDFDDTILSTAPGQNAEDKPEEIVPNVAMLIVQLTIGSIGLLSNGFVVVVIVCFTSMHKQLANVFVINQSVIDGVSSLILIIQAASSSKIPSLIPGHLGSELYCRVWQSGLLQWSVFTSSTYNLVVLTIERYLKIVHPIIHKTSFTFKKAKALIIAVWFFGILFQSSYGIPTTTINGSTCWIVATWPDIIIQQAMGYVSVIVQYLIPVFTFLIGYSRMIRSLRVIKINNSES